MNGAGSKQSELDVITCCQGQLRIRPGIDHSAELRAFGLQDRRSGSDFDSLVHIADFELKIDAGRLIQLQTDV